MSSNFEEKEIDYPAQAFVACPKVDYALVRARERCVGCGYFNGLFDRESVKSPVPLSFYKKYMVYCSYPVVRELVEVQA